MKVKELIEELQKCNQDAEVEAWLFDDDDNFYSDFEIEYGNPASCSNPVIFRFE